MASSDRRAIHCRVSVDAHETWARFSVDNGVTIAGLLEAIAVVYRERGGDGRLQDDPTVALIVERARAVDGDRRRRGGGPG